MADNNITVIGNLVDDPELRYTASGKAMTKMRIAVNRRWYDQRAKEWTDETHFFAVSCWSDLAENVAESVRKGNRVIISGRLQQRSWETAAGERRSVVEITAEDIGASLRWAKASLVRNNRKERQGSDRTQTSSQTDENIF